MFPARRGGSTATEPPNAHHDPEDAISARAWQHGLRLAAASERFIAQLRATLRLSSNEMNALLLLHEDGACTMVELSRRIRLSRGAMSTLAHRLQKDGWVTITPDEFDRRRVIVDLSDRFSQLLRGEALHAWRQRYRNLASATEDWGSVVEHIDAICHLSLRTAHELHERAEQVTRSDA